MQIKLKQIIAGISLAVLISGCVTSNPDPVIVNDNPVQKPALNLSDPNPIELENWTIHLITPDKVTQYIDNLNKNKKPTVLIIITPEDLTALQTNNVKILNYIKQQKGIIQSYKDYYEPKK